MISAPNFLDSLLFFLLHLFPSSCRESMEARYASISPVHFSFRFLANLTCAQICHKTCDNEVLLYPFGSGSGCGDPGFQPQITFNQQKLSVTTHTGSYLVTSIDYYRQATYISDPTVSTCSGTVPSKDFGLDWDGPFTFDERTIFALLGCSKNSSSIHSSKLLCDQGTPICSLLNSCRLINNQPTSTCCVYTPVNLGPSFEMDLQKLQCSSYLAFYSFNGEISNPYEWKYGMSLKYKSSVINCPRSCIACQRSNGVCGYIGDLNSFFCNCPSGINTTTDCLFAAHYDVGLRNGVAWLLVFMAWSVVGFFF